MLKQPDEEADALNGKLSRYVEIVASARML